MTPNTSDTEKRYAFGNQKEIGCWNLSRLYNALGGDLLKRPYYDVYYDLYRDVFDAEYGERMMEKLGLFRSITIGLDDFLMKLENTLYQTGADYTLFFRHIADVRPTGSYQFVLKRILETCGQPDAVRNEQELNEWLRIYQLYLQREELADETALQQRVQKMNSVNPKFILRNWVAQQCIEEMESTSEEVPITKLVLRLLQNPFHVSISDLNLSSEMETLAYSFLKPQEKSSADAVACDGRSSCNALSCSS
jgi:uncharacterized protein YdiU (UPF0061 family)